MKLEKWGQIEINNLTTILIHNDLEKHNSNKYFMTCIYNTIISKGHNYIFLDNYDKKLKKESMKKELIEEIINSGDIDKNQFEELLTKQKYNFEIIQSDFMDVNGITEDFVLASGIFTTTKSENETESVNNMLKSIDKLYSMSNVAVSFNLLTNKNNHKHDGYLFINPGKIIDKLIKKYTYVNVYHNYSDNVYTIVIFK
jgi:hypothetical protein